MLIELSIAISVYSLRNERKRYEAIVILDSPSVMMEEDEEH